MRISEEKKSLVFKITGLLCAAFAVFALVSAFSYLFTWKADMSLLSDPAVKLAGSDVANSGGALGLRFGRFLVARCFGLGSFAFLFILSLVSWQLISGRRSHLLLKTAAISVTGGILAAVTLSFFASLFGDDLLFGGGLGGWCGHYISQWCIGLFGTIPTLALIIVLTVLLLVFSSKRFSLWLASIGSKKDTPAEDAPVSTESKYDGEEFLQTPQAPQTPQPDQTPRPMEVAVDSGFTAEGVKELPPIDVRAELPRYKMPSIDILDSHSFSRPEVSAIELTKNRNQIQAALANYRINVVDVKAVVGPTVTLYKVYPAPGVKIADIKRLQDDIALSLNAKGVRVVTLSDSVGIEVANERPTTVPVKALMNDPSFRESKAELPIAIGYTIQQKVKVFDLADAPHLLIAGATKQGKSVGLNVIVASLLYRKHPSEIKFVFIDPKMVEFSAYSKLLKHYLAVLPSANSEEDEKQNAIVKKAKDAEAILRSLCIEMDQRYELLSEALVNNVALYNDKYRSRRLNPQKGHRYLPYLVVVIDEYADLTMSAGGSAESKASSRSIQNSIIRLAQKGRAAGIHVILATQRPSVDVISGIIKTNFPTRIAFRVSSRVDSTTILDSPGAEKLIGRGDMLYFAGVETERVQCGFISNDEINALTNFIGAQQGFEKSYNTPLYLPDPAPAEGEAGGGMVDMTALDERFEEAARLIVSMQKGSTSDLQRRLGMGYAKAGRVMDQLEAAGIVGPQVGSKPREVLVASYDELEPILKAFLHK